LGGKPCHSLGMAIGIERLMILLDELYDTNHARTQLFLCADSETKANDLINIQQQLHALGFKTFLHHGTSQIKKQLNRAEKMGFKHVLLVQDDQFICYDLISKTQHPFEHLTTLQGVIEHAC
jgi:histidyl-tRNA synthetase